MEFQSVAHENTVRQWSAPQIIAATAILIVAGLLIWFATDVFLLVFMGVLLAILLTFLSRLLSDHSPLSHGWSLAVVLLGLLIIFASFVGVAGAKVAAETDNLSRDLQGAWEQLTERASKYEWSQQLISQPKMKYFTNVSGEWLGRLTGVFTTTLGALSSGLLVVFVAIFIAADPDLYRRGVLRLVPLNYRDRAREVLDEAGFSLRWWIIGQMFSMTVVGTATAVGLWFLGIPFFITLGILAGVLTFIPNFGPILSAVPAVILGLTSGPLSGLYVVLLYLGVQAIESNLLTPLVQQRNVDLPPVLAVAIQILMGVLVGVLGLIMAAPLTVLGMILVKRLYVEDTLGDSLQKSG